MKKVRVLSIIDTTMRHTDQHVAVFELSEIEIPNFKLTEGKQLYLYGSKSELYVVDYNSYLTRQLRWAGENEEVIEIDEKNFTSRIEYRKGVREKIFYHNNVIL